MKKICCLIAFNFVVNIQTQDSNFTRIQRANRRFNAKVTRITATNEQAQQKLATQATNGDEQKYSDKRASFGKSLEQQDSGLVNITAFNQMVTALQRGTSDGFLDITMGTDPVQRRLVNPQAAYAFNFDGPDSWINSMPPAPALESAQAAGEMVEVYWHALLRDVAFNDYDTNATAASAIADLNNLSDFRGPKIDGQVTAQTLFRGNTPGDLVGPLVSQFLYLAVPYGPAPNYDGTLATPGISYQAQVVPQPLSVAQNDFMTTFDEWLFIQRGSYPTRSITYDTTTRIFIRNARDIADYVHQDKPNQEYENAVRILSAFGNDALDPANPYLNNPTQESFVTYSMEDVCYLVSVVADLALRAAWYQKWIVHRRLRPEYFAFLVNQQITGTLDSNLNSDVINSQAVSSIFTHNAALTTNAGQGTYFLPIAYPEGSPTHPSYPAAHAVVAGACTTILKAFFNEDFVIPSPVEPNAANTALVASAETLTVGGELNKLAANIALARDYAGVHYRSDGFEGMNLGEKVAIGLLENEAWSRNINFTGFTLTKFNGQTITIGAKKTADKLR
jgi:hypothetical protein